MSSGKLADDRRHFRVVGCHRAAFAEIAGRARKRQVVFSAGAALRGGDPVVDMEDLPVGVVKHEDAAPGNGGFAGSPSAMHADTTVPLADGIPDGCGDVPRVAHVSSIATSSATRNATRSATRAASTLAARGGAQ